MKTFVVLSLDRRRYKKDGTCPILLRIIHHEKASQITTGIYVKEGDWDAKSRCIRPSYRGTDSVSRLNNKLQKQKAEALDIINRLDEKNTLDTYSVLELKKFIERKPGKLSLFAYTEEVIREMMESNRIGNGRAYKSMLGALRSYQGGKDISFHEVNHTFLIKFEASHFKKGNSVNGLSTYMRTLRAVFNRAIKGGTIERELYPFESYSIQTTKTRKRALSAEAMQRIVDKELPQAHQLFHTRNFFLASFYLRGMSFVDLAELKVGDIVDGRVRYERKKTGAEFDIKVQPAMKLILDFYTLGKVKGDFIFPIIKRESVEDQYKDVMWARKRFNIKLKKLADLCEIQENLSSYVSRHTFATKAKNLGIPIASISDMLGHGNIKTTEIYLDSLPSDMIDDLHEKIVS